MRKKKIRRGMLTVVILLLLLLFIVPFYLVVLNTFKTSQQFVLNPFSLPERLSFENYQMAIRKMNFTVSFRNTLLITVFTMILNTLAAAMAAYVFSRKQWRINTVVFMLFVVSMVAPFQVYMIPLVKIFGGMLGMSNRIITVIYIGTALNIPFGVFLYRGFLASIPTELDEAAMLDGCSAEGIFFRIILPLLKPIIITVMVFVGLALWNDYLMSSLFLTKTETKTLAIAIFTFLTDHSADYAPMMAGLVLGIIPVLVFYIFGQKYVIEGVVQGSVKG